MEDNLIWLNYAFNRLNQFGFRLGGAEVNLDDETYEKNQIHLIDMSDLIQINQSMAVQLMRQMESEYSDSVYEALIKDELNYFLTSQKIFEKVNVALDFKYRFRFAREVYTPYPYQPYFRVNQSLEKYAVNSFTFMIELNQENKSYGVDLGRDFVYGALCSFSKEPIKNALYNNDPRSSIDDIVAFSRMTINSIESRYN